MTLCRDWLATLWPASYKGVPFYVDRDEEALGRRIAVHEFPMRDDPYLEDMGEAARQFSVDAYVASDAADLEARALVAVMATAGAGSLMLPTHGLIMVRGVSASRQRSRDQHGYIAFRLMFLREGATGGLVTAGLAASKVLAAVSSLVTVAAQVAEGIAVAGWPERVAAAAVDELVSAGATLEAVRASYPLDGEASASARRAIETLVDEASTQVSRTDGVDGAVAEQLYVIASTVLGAMPAPEALRAVDELVTVGIDLTVDTTGTTTDQAGGVAVLALARQARLAALAAYAEVLLSAEFADRPSGITARALAAERFGAEMARCEGGGDAELYVALADLRGLICEYLTRLITNLAPVVEVSAPRMLPSLWWAWRLYGDPLRASEIVARNRLPHPTFVPATFEALAT